ncbi:MAG: PAS domain-containing protein, partial [Mycobacteriales bacterium]
MPAPQGSAARVVLPAPRAAASVALPEVSADVFAGWALSEPDAVLVVHGPDLLVSWVNHASVTAFARDERDLLGRPLSAVLCSPLPAEPLSSADLVDGVRAVVREVVVVRADGDRVPSVLRSQPVGGAWVVRVTALADAARFDDDLRLSRERFLTVTDRAPVGIFFSDVGLRLGYVNDAFAAVFATSAEALLGMRWLDQLSAAEQQALTGAMVETLAGETRELVVRVRRPSGEDRTAHVRLMPVRTERRAAGFVGTLEDVTDRLGYEASLEHQAVHDPLTGLVNRRGLLKGLTERMSERGGQRSGDAATLLFLDLDDFKLVND